MKCLAEPRHRLEAGQKVGVSSQGFPSRAAHHIFEHSLVSHTKSDKNHFN